MGRCSSSLRERRALFITSRRPSVLALVLALLAGPTTACDKASPEPVSTATVARPPCRGLSPAPVPGPAAPSSAPEVETQPIRWWDSDVPIRAQWSRPQPADRTPVRAIYLAEDEFSASRRPGVLDRAEGTGLRYRGVTVGVAAQVVFGRVKVGLTSALVLPLCACSGQTRPPADTLADGEAAASGGGRSLAVTPAA